MPPSVEEHQFRNTLLSSFSSHELSLLRPHLEALELKRRDVLERSGRQIFHVHFIEQGVISSLTRSGTHGIQTAMVGPEGMAGYSILLGEPLAGSDCLVLTPGYAFRISARELLAIALRNRRVERLLLKYAYSVSIQTAHTALANAAAKTEIRIARWLLMAHDRLEGNHLPFVHETIALMLGVYRPYITVALHQLEARGLIRVRRGSLEICDRPGLEAICRPFYGVPEAEYQRLIHQCPFNGLGCER